jgi:hypothetical protein
MLFRVKQKSEVSICISFKAEMLTECDILSMDEIECQKAYDERMMSVQGA